MSPPTKRPFIWSLWIPVILAFLLIGAAWFTVIKIARQNPTESVPLDMNTEGE